MTSSMVEAFKTFFMSIGLSRLKKEFSIWSGNHIPPTIPLWEWSCSCDNVVVRYVQSKAIMKRPGAPAPKNENLFTCLHRLTINRLHRLDTLQVRILGPNKLQLCRSTLRNTQKYPNEPRLIEELQEPLGIFDQSAWSFPSKRSQSSMPGLPWAKNAGAAYLKICGNGMQQCRTPVQGTSWQHVSWASALHQLLMQPPYLSPKTCVPVSWLCHASSSQPVSVLAMQVLEHGPFSSIFFAAGTYENID